jgi:ATP-dependent helicase HrpB
MLPPLPIDEALPQLLASLRSNHAVVLKAPTGAGKTTRVPVAIWREQLCPTGQILVLQPRRIAARATAVRMANELQKRLGAEVGFQTRFESQQGPQTRILCLTEGILQRRLLDDPFLEGVACVVFDEFHERNLASDLSLGMVRQVQQSIRPELKIVVMSATLDPAPIATYLGNCPTVTSAGRTFPVAIEYSSELSKHPLERSVFEGVQKLLQRTSGDILVFLPGVGEIRKAAKQLHELCAQLNVQLLELYGDLPADQQDAVLAPGRNRKVILSTNVAETSLTIVGVTGVVDSGLARILRFDERTGLDRLELSPISQASADQRAGRAGRTEPGVCLRLWPEALQRTRAERETPEIQRVDLSNALLQLASWIEPNAESFPWFEAPRPVALATGSRLLERLGAVQQGKITPLGETLARLPVSPRLARMLWEGRRWQQCEIVALAAAILSERSPWSAQRSASKRTVVHSSPSDVLDRVHALQAFEEQQQRFSELGELHAHAAKAIFRVRDQLLKATQRIPSPPHDQALAADDALLRSLLAGFPDRVAKRRDTQGRRGIMVGGRGVTLSADSAVDSAELFLCVEIEAGVQEALVRQASLVKREWLPAELLQTETELFFDAEREQIAARRRVYWDDLLLEDSPAPLPATSEVAAALVAAAQEHWERAFPSDHEILHNWIQRVNFVRHHMPDLDLPAYDEAALLALLPDLCQRRRSLAELRQAPWLEHVRGLLSWQQQQQVEKEAPERIIVPSGSSITLQYQGAEPPILAVRIQELFGLSQTPSVAGGRVPVRLHLLGPNYRPQQITNDLASFWKNTYPQVRKDLRARYPKHSWPEDPLAAPPQRKPGRS